jgi:hypothetical protein
VGSSPDRVKPKTIKLVFVASPLSYAALTRKNKDWLAQNQDIVFVWGDDWTIKALWLISFIFNI